MVKSIGRALSAGVLLLALVPTFAATETPRRVLVLQSFGRGFEPYTLFASVFRTELARASPQPVEFHEISLETALFGEAESEGPFVDYLVSFDSQRRLDLVVTVGGPALRFAQRNRARLFPSTPLLIAGVDERHIDATVLGANDAVVPIAIDLRAAAENIIRLLPETESLVVIVGRSPLEQFWAAEIRRELESFAGRLRLTFLDHLPLDGILKHVSALPDGTAVFYGLFVVDSGGIPYEQERALSEVCSVASAPVFGLLEHQLGQGIVGGPLVSIEGAARKAAGAALRVLEGAAPSSVRLPPIGPGAPVFDSREIERWWIDPGRLPPGSVIRFRQPGLWAVHRWRILGFAALVLIEVGLIVLLSLSARRHLTRFLAHHHGIDALARLRQLDRDVRVVFLTMHHEVMYAKRALAAGASGYVLKHSAPAELTTAVRAALEGKIYLAPAMAGEVLRALKGSRGEGGDPVASLTPRQREILQQLAEGLKAKAVAAALGISVRTVEFHKYQIMERLGVHSTAELIHLATKQGIVEI